MPTIVIDLDGTLTLDDGDLPYTERRPNTPVIEKLREYREYGYQVAIFTARNMKTHNKSVGRINAVTLPIILEWLKKHDIPYDEIYVGKPWADESGFYVDDRAIRPDEFVNLSPDEINRLLGSPLQ